MNQEKTITLAVSLDIAHVDRLNASVASAINSLGGLESAANLSDSSATGLRAATASTINALNEFIAVLTEMPKHMKTIEVQNPSTSE